jgi:hypothetical protein
LIHFNTIFSKFFKASVFAHTHTLSFLVTATPMSTPSQDSQQLIKTFLRQAAPLIRNCNEALVKRDLTGLQHHAKEFQMAARGAGQVMLEVQAQLLTQAAENREMYQVSYLLTRISKTLSVMLADAREQLAQQPQSGSNHGNATSTAAAKAGKDSPMSSSKLLGNYLIEAELLTPAQIEVALADQKVTGARLGEILATRGWIKQGTIEYIMRKVIMPDRKNTIPPAQAQQPKPAAPPQTPPSEAVNNKATLVDEHKSTYLYY